MKSSSISLESLLVATLLISVHRQEDNESTKISMMKISAKELSSCRFTILNMRYLLSSAACTQVLKTLDVSSQSLALTPVTPSNEDASPFQGESKIASLRQDCNEIFIWQQISMWTNLLCIQATTAITREATTSPLLDWRKSWNLQTHAPSRTHD